MTLIVSIRTSDGIVIAGDSLSTMRGQIQIQAGVHVKCPSCGHEHDEKANIGGLPIPTTTLSYAQKIFPFMDKFGVGTFGAGQLVGKTMYFALRELEQELKNTDKQIDSLTNAADRIGNHVHDLVKKQIPNLNSAPDNASIIGFQVVGYDSGKPRTIDVSIGKKVRKQNHDGLGATVSGDRVVVNAIWGLYAQDPQHQPTYEAFSLQDAIEYSEFLIRTTADHQKFSRALATVGGDIDVALLTPFDGYRWIKQKPLTGIIDRRIP